MCVFETIRHQASSHAQPQTPETFWPSSTLMASPTRTSFSDKLLQSKRPRSSSQPFRSPLCGSCTCRAFHQVRLEGNAEPQRHKRPQEGAHGDGKRCHWTIPGGGITTKGHSHRSSVSASSIDRWPNDAQPTAWQHRLGGRSPVWGQPLISNPNL